MLVHVLQSLMAVGFPISDYKYTGMGAIYFIDFIMFHRYLGIHNFLSVERSADNEKRVRFNRPFGCVEIEIGDILDYIPRLSPDLRHILWLDFDGILSSEMLTAVNLATTQLSPGSILLVTLDVEPPGKPEDGLRRWNPRTWRQHFVREAAAYLWTKHTARDFSRSSLLNVNARLIDNAIAEGLIGRKYVSFYPLFNFTYADGNRMLSVGGIIGTEEDGRKLDALDWKELYFLKRSLIGPPYEIEVPKVTRKERLHLDSVMPCDEGWTPHEFELNWNEVAAYRKIYRYYPAYTEMLL
jgi:hypothetical protein